MDSTLEIPVGPEAPSEARDAIVDLSSALSPEALDDARLLVSELVTNSVRHAGMGANDHIRLTYGLHGDVARVEVADRGPGVSSRRPSPRADRASGWGLVLVDRLADRWGTHQTDEASSVWFEIQPWSDAREPISV